RQVLDHPVVAQGRVPGRLPVGELVRQDVVEVVAAAQPGRPPVEERHGLGDLILGGAGVPQQVLDPAGLLVVRADPGAGQADHRGHALGHGGGQRPHPAALAAPEQGDPGRVDALLGGQAGHRAQRPRRPVLEALVAPIAAGGAAARLVPAQAGEAGPGQRLRLRPPRGARRCFAGHGYEGATVVRLEEATGRSRGSIFHHFPTKLELFLAVLEQDAEREAARWGTGSVADALSGLAAEDPDWATVVVEQSRRRRTDPTFRDRWRRRTDLVRAALRTLAHRKHT